MERQNQANLNCIVDILQDTARQIRMLEAEAQEALQRRDAIAEYRQKLQQKTLLLMELPERTADCLASMGADERSRIRSRVENFARRAEQAMELESSFYMSALLYPEDYQEGEKNDLENYIEELKQAGN